MADMLSAMREFRFLEDKRGKGGLSGPEEARWRELKVMLHGSVDAEGDAPPASPEVATIDPSAWADSGPRTMEAPAPPQYTMDPNTGYAQLYDPAQQAYVWAYFGSDGTLYPFPPGFEPHWAADPSYAAYVQQWYASQGYEVPAPPPPAPLAGAESYRVSSTPEPTPYERILPEPAGSPAPSVTPEEPPLLADDAIEEAPFIDDAQVIEAPETPAPPQATPPPANQDTGGWATVEVGRTDVRDPAIGWSGPSEVASQAPAEAAPVAPGWIAAPEPIPMVPSFSDAAHTVIQPEPVIAPIPPEPEVPQPIVPEPAAASATPLTAEVPPAPEPAIAPEPVVEPAPPIVPEAVIAAEPALFAPDAPPADRGFVFANPGTAPPMEAPVEVPSPPLAFAVEPESPEPVPAPAEVEATPAITIDLEPTDELPPAAPAPRPPPDVGEFDVDLLAPSPPPPSTPAPVPAPALAPPPLQVPTVVVEPALATEPPRVAPPAPAPRGVAAPVAEATPPDEVEVPLAELEEVEPEPLDEEIDIDVAEPPSATLASSPPVSPPRGASPVVVPPRPVPPTANPPTLAPTAAAPAAGSKGRGVVMKGEHRVVVHTIEGLVKRGTLRDADLGARLLRIELQPGESPEELPTSRVKAIFFMLVSGASRPAQEGRKLRVTFVDGRQVAGFCRSADDNEPGFFMVPGDIRTNTARIYIYRAAVRGIVPG